MLMKLTPSSVPQIVLLPSMANRIKIILFFKKATECFADLGKLNITMALRLEPIFNADPAASKNDARFKRAQN